MKSILTLVFLILHSAPVQACSWSMPTGMTSEWVEDKVVFWGRPIETKWDKSGKNDFLNFNTYTTIEVLEPVNGNLPKKVRVYHTTSTAACGVSFQLGSIGLFVVSQGEGGRFSTGSYITEAVSEIVVSAYVNDGINLPLTELEKLRRSFYMLDNSCKAYGSDDLPEPDYCKWENVYSQAAKSYSNKITQLLEKETNNKWWQKLSWFTDKTE